MDLLSAKKEYGSVYAIAFPNGDKVSFRLLPYKRYIQYKETALLQTVPTDIIETSVYRECVIDHYYLENALELRAGVVSTVANTILKLSGPSDMEHFNETLEGYRGVIENGDNGLKLLAYSYITTAFPSYTYEQLDDIDWQTLMIRLAEAESLLKSRGWIKEDIKAILRKERKHIDFEQELRDMERSDRAVPRKREPPTPEQQAQMKTIREIIRRRREG